jgi:hypothetical protein
MEGGGAMGAAAGSAAAAEVLGDVGDGAAELQAQARAQRVWDRKRGRWVAESRLSADESRVRQATSRPQASPQPAGDPPPPLPY